MSHSASFPYRGAKRWVQWEGTSKRADKAIPQGGEYLIGKEHWPDVTTLHGRDPDILSSPLMEYAFQRVVKLHRAHHRTALFSLCTATRPYTLSRKWGKYVQAFESYADLIVHSNGGIIPLEFEGQFPYLNYDAHGERQFDALYIEVGIERAKTFLKAHRYENVLFNYRHNMRNVKIAEVVGPWAIREGLIRRYTILPTAEQYAKAKAEGFVEAGFKMYPELWPSLFDPVLNTLKEWAL